MEEEEKFDRALDKIEKEKQVARDWLEEKETVKIEDRMKIQGKLSSWLGKEDKQEVLEEVIEEKEKIPAKRMKGRLTKEEEVKMKKCHKSITEMLATPPPSSRKPISDEDKVKKKENLKRKILEYKAKKSVKPTEMKKTADDSDGTELGIISDVSNGASLNMIMTAEHTPLLRPTSPTLYSSSAQNDSRAEFNEWHGRQAGVVQPDISADIRKVDTSHGSPNLQINLCKSPTMIGGRVEMFGNITDMIGYWEEKEKYEEQPGEPGGRRRKSRKMSELCGIFEGRRSEQSVITTSEEGGEGGGIGERIFLLESAESLNGAKEETSDFNFYNSSQNMAENLLPVPGISISMKTSKDSVTTPEQAGNRRILQRGSH